MHARAGKSKDTLIPLINEVYERIRMIEAEQGLWAGANDFRPRIDLFHDAIRAYTAGHSPYEENGRLTLERLAWDIEMLRALQASPLTQLPGAQKQSPQQAVAIRRPQANAGQDNRAIRNELAGYYKNYAVFFVAILAETADMNHKARMEERDNQVEALAGLDQAVAGKSSVNLKKVTQSQIPDQFLRESIDAMLPNGTLAGTDAKKSVKQAQSVLDKQQAQLEKLHMTWLSGQLAMYEESKEVVQQLLRSGLNMAGKFLQDAMSQGGRGAGGRGV